MGLNKTIFAIIFLISSETLNASKPYFLETPQNVSAVIGRDAHFNCSVVGARQYQVAWLDMSLGVLLSYQGTKFSDHPRVQIQHLSSSTGVDSFILSLKNIVSEDEGTFVCQVNTEKPLHRNFTLSIVVPPSIEDSSSSSDVTVSEGDSTVLRCRANGIPSPTITWRREDMSLISQLNKKESKVTGNDLSLTKITRSDAGPYLCIATNGILPSVSKRIRVGVNFAPIVQPEETTVYSIEGEKATLECMIDAFPFPQTFWAESLSRKSLKYNNLASKRRFESSVRKLSETSLQMTLTVLHVSSKDFRSYSCISNNSFGIAEAVVHLSERPTTISPRLSSTEFYGDFFGTGQSNIIRNDFEPTTPREQFKNTKNYIHTSVTTSLEHQSHFQERVTPNPQWQGGERRNNRHKKKQIPSWDYEVSSSSASFIYGYSSHLLILWFVKLLTSSSA